MRARLVLLGGQTIALGLMMAFLVVPVSALFLDEYGATALPYVYLAVAASGVALSAVMTRAARRLSVSRLAIGVLCGYLIVAATGWLLLTAAGQNWVTFPLLVLFPLSIPVGFVLVGTQAGRLLDVRQLKAQFPRVAAGFSVGFAAGGLASAALVSPLGGPAHLLAVDALAAGTMLVLVVATARRFPDELRAEPEPPAAGPVVAASDVGRAGWAGPGGWRNRLLVMILGYQVLSAAVTQLLDFMVWERAAARFPDATDLARFQGMFGAVINVVSVLFVVILAGRLLTRFGIGFGLAANPLGVLVLVIATTASGYATGLASLLFFGLVCAQQVTDITLTDGTTRASINATYQALPATDRVRAQTLVEAAGVPLALGFVGLLLIGHDLMGLDVRALAVVTLVLTTAWLATAVLAYREYGASLRTVLSRREWDSVALRIDDAASERAVDELLDSPDPQDVRVALDALADAGRDVAGYVLSLLDEEEPARRGLGIEVAVTVDPASDPRITDRLHHLLADSEPDLGLRAAAALARVDDPRGTDARSAWVRAVESDDPDLVGRALRVARDLPHESFVPHLLRAATTPAVTADALDALAAHCDHLAPAVAGLLADPAVPRQTRDRLVHLLGQATTPQARDLLVAHLDDDDPAIVEAAATCLVAVGHRETAGSRDLAPRVAQAGERAARCLRILRQTRDCRDHEPLRFALRDELHALARRAEVLLELVHDTRAIGFAVADLGSPVERTRSTAREMLEVTVDRTVRTTTLGLVDPMLHDHERLQLLSGAAEPRTRPLADWLHELVTDGEGYWNDPWLRACAMYALPVELPDAAAVVAPFLADPDRDVAETARWVAARGADPDRARLDATT